MNYTCVASSEENLKDGSYEEVFQSEDGKVEARISLTKSASMVQSVTTPNIKFSCGNL